MNGEEHHPKGVCVGCDKPLPTFLCEECQQKIATQPPDWVDRILTGTLWIAVVAAAFFGGIAIFS